MRARVAFALVALVAALAAAAALDVRSSYGARVTGDEPQYLLTAVSLWDDGDLDVSDEIAARAYAPFHEVPLDPQTRPLDGGREVSPHDPLLPALLAPPVAAWGWVGAKLALAALAGALAACTAWLAVRRLGAPLVPACVLVGLFGASAPLSVYGAQVYPELPAALCVAAGTAAVTGRLGRAGLCGVAAAVVALPWLSVKYAPVAATLAAVALARLVRRGRTGSAAGLAAGLAVAAVAFVVAHRAWYGGWTPYAAGDHFTSGELGVVGFDPDYAGRSVRLAGLLLDRAFGVAAWQPAFLLVVPALAALAARRPGWWPAVVGPLAAGWLTATFVALTMHGWWFAGRQVVVVLPLAVALVAWWAGDRAGRVALAAALGAWGVASHAWLVAAGVGGRVAMAVDFFAAGGPHGVWGALLPDYRAGGAGSWARHAAWLGAGAAAAAWAWRTTRGARAAASPVSRPRSAPARTP
ncbi:MAG TPA: hypothetical protein VHJ34_11580 [Actinomycetota bacterium]|nr:hypothetical protein [Actinomycetota bacterium]